MIDLDGAMLRHTYNNLYKLRILRLKLAIFEEFENMPKAEILLSLHENILIFLGVDGK